jgi:hypothetical protein
VTAAPLSALRPADGAGVGSAFAAGALQDIRFGRGGNDRNYLGAGWSADENGWRWMTGERSEVIFSHPPDGAPAYVLEMEYSVFVAPPELPAQRLIVKLGEIVVFKERLTHAGHTGFVIDAAALGDGPVRLSFEHPDAAAPARHGQGGDQRLLSVRVARMRLTPVPASEAGLPMRAGQNGVRLADVERLTGMKPAAFITRFESLGDNCEFGLVQRQCGAEPLGLFRFSYIALEQLLRGLEQGFVALGKPEQLRCRISPGPPPEFIIEDDGYAMIYHTFQYDPAADPVALLANQPARQRFLARKLMEDVAQGEKIFVIRRSAPLTEHDVLPLHGLLNRLGRNTLLYVVPAEDDTPPGTVEQVIPGLLKGSIARLAPDDNAHDLAVQSWLEVCVNAWKLYQPGTDHGARPEGLQQTG